MSMADSAASHIGQGSRLDGIDLLRGLAIFYVLMLHVSIRLHGAHVPYTNYLPKLLVDALVENYKPNSVFRHLSVRRVLPIP